MAERALKVVPRAYTIMRMVSRYYVKCIPNMWVYDRLPVPKGLRLRSISVLNRTTQLRSALSSVFMYRYGPSPRRKDSSFYPAGSFKNSIQMRDVQHHRLPRDTTRTRSKNTHGCYKFGGYELPRGLGPQSRVFDRLFLAIFTSFSAIQISTVYSTLDAICSSRSYLSRQNIWRTPNLLSWIYRSGLIDGR